MEPGQYEQLQRLEDNHWWFMGRRHLALQELKRFRSHRPGPILDLGCGTGGMLPHLLEIGRAVGFDNAAEAAQGCHFRGVPFVLGWGSRLPFADGTFDTVTAFDVIEHIEDDLAALREVLRVLRPGGLFVATVPAYQFMWSRHDVVNHHFRRYRRRGLRRVLIASGFCVEKLSYYNMLLFPAFLVRVGLMRLGRGQLPASDLVEVAAPVNGALKRVMVGESHLIRRFNLPFGASLVCVARRPA